MITQRPLETFLDELASGAPTPGGGSAAAIMGAMGAALVSMVCNVTLGKKGQEHAAAEMLAVLAESEILRARLTAMVDEEIAAFDSLIAAHKLPKTSDDDKAQRSAHDPTTGLLAGGEDVSVPGNQGSGGDRRHAQGQIGDAEHDGEHAGPLVRRGEGHDAAHGALEAGAEPHARDGSTGKKYGD